MRAISSLSPSSFMRLAVILALCLFPIAGCHAKPQPVAPAQDQAVHRPATLEEERAMLEQEKAELVGSYSENIDRIQQINARIIEINIILRQRGSTN